MIRFARGSALRIVGVLAAALIAACATAGTRASRGTGDTIGRQALLDGGANNVYDAISKVRPQCLRPRSSTGAARRVTPDTSAMGGPTEYGGSSRAITVYVDGVKTGSADDLRTMSLASVTEVQCLGPSDAAQRFGLNNAAGAILVKTGAP